MKTNAKGFSSAAKAVAGAAAKAATKAVAGALAAAAQAKKAPPPKKPPLAPEPDQTVAARVVKKADPKKKDAEETPISRARYEIRKGGAAVAAGETGHDGLIVKQVPAGSYEVKLVEVPGAAELPKPKNIT